MDRKDIDLSVQQKPETKLSGPYSQAVYNPDPRLLSEMLQRASRTILEIGCGARPEPRVSWRLGRGDLWVGCDPLISGDRQTVRVHNGGRGVSSDAQMVVFPYTVANIPRFQPDIISMVAPNQQDIVDGHLFNDDLREFLGRKPQTFVIVMEKRTWESKGYQTDAMRVISAWMKENRFVHDPEAADLHNFSPNSRDLDAFGRNVRRTYVRYS